MNQSSRTVYRILGKAIRAQRENLGLTQEKLAKSAGLTRNYIGNIERAEYKPSIDTLLKTTRPLNCRLRDLFRGL
jgi:XRE family transcriptional regulator, regulator of sulfur utilization